MSFQTQIDVTHLVKILNDVKDYFLFIHDENERRRAGNCVSYILDSCSDCADNPDFVRQCYESEIFAFSDIQKEEFVKCLQNKPENLDEKYGSIGTANLLTILDASIVSSITLKSQGSTYRGSVANYELQLKPNITIKNLIYICRKFMDHPNHCISSFEWDGSHAIKVFVDEST